MRSIVRSGATARVGAILIFIGPLVSRAAEFITAAARQHPQPQMISPSAKAN